MKNTEMVAAQVWSSFGELHARCTSVCVHTVCLLWQLLLFACECLEGGARTGEVTRGEKKEVSAVPEWQPGGGKSLDWLSLSRGEFVRVCGCKSVRMCDSLVWGKWKEASGWEPRGRRWRLSWKVETGRNARREWRLVLNRYGVCLHWLWSWMKSKRCSFSLGCDT